MTGEATVATSTEVSTVATRTSRPRRYTNEEDVAATRHLRLLISSIAENNALSPNQRQERIGNFGTLLGEAERKLQFNGDIHDDALMFKGGKDSNRRGLSITSFKTEAKKEYSKQKKSLFGRLRRKKSKKSGHTVNEGMGPLDRNLQLETLVEERQDEALKASEIESNNDNSATAREEAPQERQEQQPCNIYIPVAQSTRPNEINKSDDKSCTSSIIDVRMANSEEYTASICSIRSLGTFEKDFINNVIVEQQAAVEEISVSTFEQDAGMKRGKNDIGFPTEIGTQPLQNEDDDDLTMDLNLSETTFERDAKTVAGTQIDHLMQVEFSSKHGIMMQDGGDDLFDGLSETTSGQDHVSIMTEIVSQPDIQNALSEGSLRSVSTFEKDAAARAALAVKIGRTPSSKVNAIQEVSSEGTFEKDQRLRQALHQSRQRSQVSVSSGSKKPPASFQTERKTVYEHEAHHKIEEESISIACKQRYNLANNDHTNEDGESRFERDVSRNTASYAVNIVSVPQNQAPLPRINDLVIELSPEAIQKQEKQMARQRSNNGGVLSRFMCHCGLGERSTKLI